jgi:ribosomal protein L2
MRAAGTHAKIIKKDRAHAIVRLHSGKLYSISTQSMATIGIVSNDSHKNIKLTKAGQSR